MLPENEQKGLSAEDDFAQTWDQINAPRRAVEMAKLKPICWTKELDEKLSPASPQFKIFCDTAIYLQTMAGTGGHILLPQPQLAKLIGGKLKQGGVSTYIHRAADAGLLILVDGYYSKARRISKKWRCTETYVLPELKTE